jgi:uncharacterized protein YndB with AHSA1/START domain
MTAVQAIKHTIIVNAPIERVWVALTTPEDVAIWVGAIGFKPELGAKFEFHATPQGDWNGITYSEVTEIIKPNKLSFTWSVPNFPATLVTFILRDLGGKTEVTLEHTGWDKFGPEILPVRDQLDQGWGGHVLPQLAQFVESCG